ncbi:hypothetical protein C8J57DRAFT_1306848 [Mycena rebaudengoi]|nr:hypothetical protein C8J57DRAFT_1306848 [Mycena rebaudengoi]
MVRFTSFFALSILLATVAAVPSEYSDSYHGEKCRKEGEMICVGDNFATCDHGRFVLRYCALGTACRPFRKSILCDYDHRHEHDY